MKNKGGNERIEEFLVGVTREVEEYNADLTSKKEELERTRDKVQKWFRESSITEQIQQQELMSWELESSMKIDVDVYKLTANRPSLHYLS